MRLISLLFLTVIMAISSCEARDLPTLFPRPLSPGDTIAILAPAGPIKNAPVDSAAAVLEKIGYVPVIYPHTFGEYGHFSGTHQERLEDLTAAFTDPSVRAILCARGGYGVAHNLDSLARLNLRKDPKWVIGFSDISALHALMASQGVASVHASMAKQIALGPDDPDNAALLGILTDSLPTYTFEPDPRNHPGTATAPLLGGNLAVIADLIATPYDIIRPGTILFIEDVSEPIYKIERILLQLKMMGVFDRIAGLVVGQFTEYNPDGNHESMEDMIAEILEPYPSLPVAFNVPVGHVDHNVPLVEGSMATLTVAPDSVTLSMAK